MPKKRNFGNHSHLGKFQFVFGKSLSLNHFPLSTTSTLYPFSASLKALTLPPKPEPMIR